MVAYLLANGAQVDKTDDNGWTPLHIAGRCIGLSHDVLLYAECLVSHFKSALVTRRLCES